MDESYIVCNACNGTGCGDILEESRDYLVHSLCDKCNGRGQITWLENIFGVINKTLIYTTIMVVKREGIINEKDRNTTSRKN
jgi:hypothetical protein